MKKRNEKFFKEKDYIRLLDLRNENWAAQRRLGYVELDVPVHKGYIAFLKLRSDVANRQDSWVFQEIIDKFGTRSYADKIKYFNWDKKLYDRKTIVYSKPHIREITEYQYNSLNPQVKKYFELDKHSLFNTWKGCYYYCTVPNFFFEVVIEKYWITEIRVFDEVLQQEEAEIKAEIKRKHYDRYYKCEYTRKCYKKITSGKLRAATKQYLYKVLNEDKDTEIESLKYFY